MLHVRGAAVRFVHVPGRLEPNAAIVSHRQRVAEAAKAARRQHDAGLTANWLTNPSPNIHYCAVSLLGVTGSLTGFEVI